MRLAWIGSWISLLLAGAPVSAQQAPPTAPAPAEAPGAPAAGSARLQLHPEAVRLRAEVLLAEGQYGAAGRMLQAYLRGNPDDGAAWLLQARVFRNIKQYPLVFKALARAGEREGVHLVAARTYLEMGQKDKALAEIRESVRRYPELGDAHHFLGYLYATQKEYEKAVESLKTALDKKTTKRVPTYFYLGQSLYELKRYDEAEKYLRLAQREGGETDYAKPTEDFLDLILLRKQQLTKVPEAPKPAGPARKPWRAYAQLAVEYDTNVTLLPDVESTPGLKAKDGVRNVLSSGIDGRIYKNKDWRLRGNADLTFAYDYLVEEVQLLALQGGLYSPWGILLGKDPGSITPYVSGRTVFYGKFGDGDLNADSTQDVLEFGLNDPFSVDVEGGVRLVWQQDETASLIVATGYFYSWYTNQEVSGGNPQSDRNGHNIRLSIIESLIFSARSTNDLTAVFFLSEGLRTAKDTDFAYWALEAGGQASWRVADPAYVDIGLTYKYENHYDSGPIKNPGSSLSDERVDQTFSAQLGGRYRVFKEPQWTGWAVLRALYEHNFSTIDATPDLTYDKFVISLAFRAEF